MIHCKYNTKKSEIMICVFRLHFVPLQKKEVQVLIIEVQK